MDELSTAPLLFGPRVPILHRPHRTFCRFSGPHPPLREGEAVGIHRAVVVIRGLSTVDRARTASGLLKIQNRCESHSPAPYCPLAGQL